MALCYVENLKTFIDEIGFKTVSSIKLQEAEKRKYENLGEKNASLLTTMWWMEVTKNEKKNLGSNWSFLLP